MSDTCPKCGAARNYNGTNLQGYECGTREYYSDHLLVQSAECCQRVNDVALTRKDEEIARLRKCVEARDAKRWATNASPTFCLFCEVGTLSDDGTAGDPCSPDCPTVLFPLEVPR